MKEAIYNENPPFELPPSLEVDGEPPFLDEWFNADLSIDMIGLTSVSLLSDSLKIYFETLRREVLRVDFAEKEPFKKGFVLPYKVALADHLCVDWSEEGVDFEIIEQVVLARNDAQHSKKLQDIKPDHTSKTVERFPDPVFSQGFETEMMIQTKSAGRFGFSPSVHVEQNSLFRAIAEIEKLAEVIDKKVYRRK
jgi:hypothetical protein